MFGKRKEKENPQIIGLFDTLFVVSHYSRTLDAEYLTNQLYVNMIFWKAINTSF